MATSNDRTDGIVPPSTTASAPNGTVPAEPVQNAAPGAHGNNRNSATTSKPLKVLVIGAGIAGLSAAAALRQAGHHSRIANEIGAAIHVGVNASQALAYLGSDPARLQSVECQTMTLYSPEGKKLREVHHEWPWVLTHRADLHNELKLLALDPSRDGKEPVLHLSSRVVSVDPVAGTIVLGNGEEHHGDLIVGADGIYASQKAKQSTTREKVFADNKPLESVGTACYRFTVPAEKIEADPSCLPVVGGTGMTLIIAPTDPTKRIIIYPCRNGCLLNFVCMHPDTHGEVSKSWNTAATTEDVLSTYKDWAPSITGLIAKADADDVRCWRLLQRPNLATFSEGRFCVVGDAAHPMLPHQGQGGGQAIEDGVALGVLFEGNVAADNVPALLDLYQQVRYARATAVQTLSREAAVGSSKLRPDAVQRYVFGHNVVDYAKHARSSIFLPPQ
ncbi:hypothetical protein SBRCBS47491_002661 [Sporothrix bragantina]|uniref:FAD-binding domain-containing protein n=1 Tax=Sporothrix bragantina TaxID=671064 RepID=A0ABP0B9G6_9PEZI